MQFERETTAAVAKATATAMATGNAWGGAE